MSLSVEQMEASLRKLLGGVDTSDLTSLAAVLLLNESYWEVLDKFPFREKQVSSTFAFVTGQRLYTAPSPFEAVTKIVLRDPNNDSFQDYVLKRMSLDWYENQYNANTTSVGTPEWYLRYADGFYVYPTPDLDYDGIIYYNTVLSDLSGNSTVPPLPQVWHEIIKYGAAFRGWNELGDLNRATYYRNLQISLMDSTEPTEAKEEEDSPLSGVSVPTELTEQQW